MKEFLGKKRKSADDIFEITENEIRENEIYLGKNEIKQISFWENEGYFTLNVIEKDKYRS